MQVQLIYKPFEDDEEDEPGEPEPYELLLEEQNITDVKSAAGAPRSASTEQKPLIRTAGKHTRTGSLLHALTPCDDQWLWFKKH